MTRQLINPSEPLYSRIWQQLKNFPKGLSTGSKTSPTGSGSAAAALISAGIGCFVMMVTHHLADTSKEREAIIWQLGSWIPGSHNPSKLLLVGWLVSWVILHLIWKNKNVKVRTIYFWMFIL